MSRTVHPCHVPMSLLGLIGLLMVHTARADEPSLQTNPQLLQQATPQYPASAAGMQGQVTLRVTVGVDGQVLDVDVLDGPSIFYDEAIRAAHRLRFAPATRHAQPVVATTLVYFRFAPPTLAEQPPQSTGELLIESHVDAQDTHSRTTLDQADLQQAAGRNLAETVSQTPGVTLSGGSSDNAKPIIRGQSERRLLILYDGTRHESQKWGPDHAPEIDLFSAGEVSIIKGAAGARYGPDAIGGVLLIEPPPMRIEPGVGGTWLTAASSNGRQGYTAMRLDAAPTQTSHLSYRIEGNLSRGADQLAPDYVLGNTASALWNVGGAIEYRHHTTEICLSYQHHDARSGIFYGTTSASPDEFLAQYESGRPVNADVWQSTYEVDRPAQEVTHDRVLLHTTHTPGTWLLQTRYTFQHNHRQEFEQVRQSIEGAQYDFTLRTHSVDVHAEHAITSLGTATLEGGIGLQGIFQENVYQGYRLLPNYRSFGGGIFAHERLLLPWGAVEVGARYDGLQRSAFLAEEDILLHQSQGTLAPSDCTDISTAWQCPAAYQAGSFSLGGLWHAVPDTLEFKLDLSSASRFPNADELYLIGYAPSFPVYALGDPNLDVETTWGLSPTVGVRTGMLESEISGYANLTRDHIYFSPTLGTDGQPLFEVTIQGTWPQYHYHPIDALFTGVDGHITLGEDAPVGIRLQGAVVRSQNVATQETLVGTPPDRARLSLLSHPPDVLHLQHINLAVHLDAVARQSRTLDQADLVPAPDGYTLLGGSLSATLPLASRALRLGVDATNLLNQSYRDYTSLLRYFADQPGRDVRLHLGMDF